MTDLDGGGGKSIYLDGGKSVYLDGGVMDLMITLVTDPDVANTTTIVSSCLLLFMLLYCQRCCDCY